MNCMLKWVIGIFEIEVVSTGVSGKLVFAYLYIFLLVGSTDNAYYGVYFDE